MVDLKITTFSSIKFQKNFMLFLTNKLVWYGMVWYGIVEFNIPLDTV